MLVFGFYFFSSSEYLSAGRNGPTLSLFWKNIIITVIIIIKIEKRQL